MRCLALILVLGALCTANADSKHRGGGGDDDKKHEKKEQAEKKKHEQKDEDGKFRYKEREGGRKLEIKKKDHEVEIKAEAKASTSGGGKGHGHYDKDALKWEVETHRGKRKDEDDRKDDRGGHLEIKFKYESRVNGTETKLSFRTRLLEIVEFEGPGDYMGVQQQPTAGNSNSNNASAAAAPGQTVVQRYRIGDGGWDNIAQTARAVPNSSGTLYAWTARTADGVLEAVMRLATEALTDPTDALRVSADAVKLDVRVANFPYASNTSRLALVGRIKTKTKQKFRHEREERKRGKGSSQPKVDTNADADEDEDEERVLVNAEVGTAAAGADGAYAAGRFDWNKTVLLDGNATNMTSVLVETPAEDDEDDEVNRDMYFTVGGGGGGGGGARAALVVWDPSIGVAYTPDLGGSASSSPASPVSAAVIAVGCVCAAAALAAAMVVTKRRRAAHQAQHHTTKALSATASLGADEPESSADHRGSVV